MNDPRHLLPPKSDQLVVLVADDEVMILNIARIALETEGYFVLTAENGNEALELARLFPSKIDLLVSDIKMPQMDGLALRERILAERPGIKVLLMSGFASPTVCPFLSKPFQIGELKKRVNELLTSAASA